MYFVRFKSMNFFLIGILLISGCVAGDKTLKEPINIERTNMKSYTFPDTNNPAENDQQCSQICMERETKENLNGCHYEPPTFCENGFCVCETWF